MPFEWTRVYSFGPYFPLKDIERITGSKSPALNDSVTEEMENMKEIRDKKDEKYSRIHRKTSF